MTIKLITNLKSIFLNKDFRLKILHIISSISFAFAWSHYRMEEGISISNLGETFPILIVLFIGGLILTMIISYLSVYFAYKYFLDFDDEKYEINYESDEVKIIMGSAYFSILLFCIFMFLFGIGATKIEYFHSYSLFS